MMHTLQLIKVLRKSFTALIEELTIEQLNTVPAGFTNNIAWNYGHIAIATEAIFYIRTGVQPDRQMVFSEKYKNGSRPDAFIGREEIEQLKTLMNTLPDQVEQDYRQGLFSHISLCKFTTFATEAANFEELTQVVLMHETLHYGYCKAIKRLV